MKALVLAMGGLLVVGCGTSEKPPTSATEETSSAADVKTRPIARPKVSSTPVPTVNFCGKQWPADAKSITCSQVSDLKGIGAFKALQTLDLGGTNVTDAGLKHLAGLKALKQLSLWRTKVTDARAATTTRFTKTTLFILSR